jgi:hypothetical protein
MSFLKTCIIPCLKEIFSTPIKYPSVIIAASCKTEECMNTFPPCSMAFLMNRFESLKNFFASS